MKLSSRIVEFYEANKSSELEVTDGVPPCSKKGIDCLILRRGIDVPPSSKKGICLLTSSKERDDVHQRSARARRPAGRAGI